jgi:hypothetical protein
VLVSSATARVCIRPLDEELLPASEGALPMDAKSLKPELSGLVRLAIGLDLGVGDGWPIEQTCGATAGVGGGSYLSQ